MKGSSKIFIVVSLLFTSSFSQQEWWQKIEKDWKPSVVSVRTSFKNYLNLESSIGTSSGTGFVVDEKNGFIVTNAHVAGANPGQYMLEFYNNERIRARLRYLDPWHDFAVLQYRPSELSFKAKQVVLGRHLDLKEGEELVLIGNSSGQGLSTKLGIINKLFIDKGANILARYSHYIHTSLPRAGGSSGSPLWNVKGKVVGLHAIGNEQESFELRIDYILDALADLKIGRVPIRGDLHFTVNAISWKAAEQWFHYPRRYVEDAPKENAELHYVLTVGKILPGSRAYEVLKQGDVIVGFNEGAQLIPIGYSLYDFDRYVNGHVGKEVSMRVFRREGSEVKTLNVKLSVTDANQSFAKKFASFAGGIFQDITPAVGLKLGIPMEGVFISQADPGTAFYDAGNDTSREEVGRKLVTIKEINGVRLHNLGDFKEQVSKIKPEDYFTATVCDLMYYSKYDSCSYLEMNLSESESYLTFLWNPTTLDWETVE